MSYHLLSLAAALVLVTLASAQMSIYGPEMARSMDLVNQSNLVNFSLFNFGKIPYGRQIIGEVVVSIPLDGCSEISADNYDSQVDMMETNFLIMNDANCSIQQKARTAQNFGAKLVIIINQNSDSLRQVLIQGDANSVDLSIPAILISSHDGSALIAISEAMSRLYQKTLILSIFFEIVKSKVVKIDYFSQLQDQNSQNLQENFIYFFKHLKNSVNYEPHYQIYSCNECSESTNQDEWSNCLGDGRYCVHMSGTNNSNSGRSVLQEILRQKCIKKLSSNKIFYHYMEKFHSNCNAFENWEYCSVNQIMELNQDLNMIQECISSSFVSGTMPIEKKRNSLLDEELSLLHEAQIYEWPMVYINNLPVHEQLTPKLIFQIVCQHFVTPIKECVIDYDNDDNESSFQFQKQEQSSTQRVSFIFVLLESSLGVLLGTVLLYFLYRNYLSQDEEESNNLSLNQLIGKKYLELKQSTAAQEQPDTHISRESREPPENQPGATEKDSQRADDLSIADPNQIEKHLNP